MSKSATVTASGLAQDLALEGILIGVPLIHPILGLNDVFGLVPDSGILEADSAKCCFRLFV